MFLLLLLDSVVVRMLQAQAGLFTKFLFPPDIPLCKGLVDVKIDPHRLNCVEFVWDPQQTETKVAIKIHCISTEFTAKKHGGEKGVPFRIQVETYMYYTTPAETDVPLLLHCASCQVKVFKVSVVLLESFYCDCKFTVIGRAHKGRPRKLSNLLF